ncbi:hypothetical protein BH09PSE6_BH09PSE6_11190 [soil metagenome]
MTSRSVFVYYRVAAPAAAERRARVERLCRLVADRTVAPPRLMQRPGPAGGPATWLEIYETRDVPALLLALERALARIGCDPAGRHLEVFEPCA